MLNTEDIRKEFIQKYAQKDFRIIGNKVQQSKTIELQNVQFEVDKPWIIREPNYEYFNREFEWYKTQSLNVNDIPGGAPKMWKACATSEGLINSNYGWMIWSKENGYQFDSCFMKLLNDPHTREACMIYNRPSMQEEYCKDGMHDFCCTYAVQCFLNEDEDNQTHLKYIVYQRSQDAVFGFDNDILWHQNVQLRLAEKLSMTTALNRSIICDKIINNVGSLHVYERHFKYLEEK